MSVKGNYFNLIKFLNNIRYHESCSSFSQSLGLGFVPLVRTLNLVGVGRYLNSISTVYECMVVSGGGNANVRELQPTSGSAITICFETPILSPPLHTHSLF